MLRQTIALSKLSAGSFTHSFVQQLFTTCPCDTRHCGAENFPFPEKLELYKFSNGSQRWKIQNAGTQIGT